MDAQGGCHFLTNPAGSRQSDSSTANVDGGNQGGTKCGQPKLLQSTDGLRWTICSAGSVSGSPARAVTMPFVTFAGNDKVYLEKATSKNCFATTTATAITQSRAPCATASNMNGRTRRTGASRVRIIASCHLDSNDAPTLPRPLVTTEGFASVTELLILESALSARSVGYNQAPTYSVPLGFSHLP